jgi:assimilatory nitrate reductase catalytic subunit
LNGPRHDWEIATEIGRRLEKWLPARSRQTLFPYTTPESIWNEHRESSRGRDLDITGLSYTQLEAAPQQWPYPQGHSAGQARLYTDLRFATPDGKARFSPAHYLPTAEQRNSSHPYSLTTGRLRDQWHGMTRTASIGALLGHTAQPEVQINPDDLLELQAQAGDLLRISSLRGSVVLPAVPTPDMGRKQLFVPMHWGGEFLGGHNRDGSAIAGINALTTPAFCPTSKQPEFKHAAVRLEKAALPWRLQAMAQLPPGQALRVQRALRPWMAHFQHAVCVPFGENGVWFQAAHTRAPKSAWLQALCEHLGLNSLQTLRYDDGPRHVYRRIQASQQPETGERRLQAFLLAGTAQSFHWMSTLLQGQVPLTAPAWTLLQDLTEPTGQAAAPKIKPLCNCLGVGEQAVINALGACAGTPSARLAQLQTQLKCGTQCGSCVPEIKRLIEQHPTVGAS